MGKSFKRILLKLSGEGLLGDQAFGIDEKVLDTVAESIKSVYNKNTEICVVIGGGNFYRGVNNKNTAISRSVADQAGMLATVLNAIFLKSILNSKGVDAEILSGLAVPQVAESYSYRALQNLLQKKNVVIFAGGTGNPYFTTDTGATLRALEANCDALFKATQVDGVYDSDPKKNPDAKHFSTISYNDVIEKELRVMDLTAISMAKDNNLPIVVFKQTDKKSLSNALEGKGKFTIIKWGNMTDFNQIKADTSARMEKTLDTLKNDFGGLRAGRAHASLLDNIMVEAYGSLSPISQVGTISVPDARTLSVSVWDRGLAKSVEKALRESDLGLNPVSDGQLIRIPIPPLSEERRKELVKIAGKYAEQNKVAIRNIRRDALDEVKKLKKDNLISEDDEKRYSNEIQKLTDDATKKIDDLLDQKEKDILQV